MKVIEDHIISEVLELTPGHVVLRAQRSSPLPLILPGNFAEIEIPASRDVFLRRPFTFLDADIKSNTVSFYIKTIGKGTKILASLQTGDKLNIMYPLGNSFTIPDRGSKVMMVGGGSGIAPFGFLGRMLHEHGVECHFVIGGKTISDIHFVHEMEKFGTIHITTEDGSAGVKGLVTDSPMFKENHGFSLIYACGPEGMMKATGKWAHEKGIPCEVSLENTMACGFGACLCCITPTTTGNRCVCTDGPVFKFTDILWQS